MPNNQITKYLRTEYLTSDTIEKAFYIFELDHTRYDLFYDRINVCNNAEWDFSS